MKTFQVFTGRSVLLLQSEGALSVIRQALEKEPKARKMVIKQIYKHN